jgi:hypothetical protein
MTTTARASHPPGNVSPPSLDAAILANLTASLRADLCRHAASGGLAARATLEELFSRLFGPGRPRSEQIRFVFFAAPIVRRIMVASVDVDARVGATDITWAEVKSWLWWLDTTDPLCARMIDLHYFAGLSIKETAAVLRLPAAAVIRELRFAGSWLRIRVPSGSQPD